jgi:hypothetical protein
MNMFLELSVLDAIEVAGWKTAVSAIVAGSRLGCKRQTTGRRPVYRDNRDAYLPIVRVSPAGIVKFSICSLIS